VISSRSGLFLPSPVCSNETGDLYPSGRHLPFRTLFISKQYGTIGYHNRSITTPANGALVHPPADNRHLLLKRIAEVGLVAVVLLITFHLLNQRINQHTFPSGDEGSWMGVASQLERGEGFTTRWFEHPYLKHPMLPRPDDYRYPGLSLILAGAFHLFGTTYGVGLMTVALFHLVFLVLFYYTIRKRYGVTVAGLSLAVTALSLLQLYWNSAVYSEGLFGIGLSLVTMAILYQDLTRYRSWMLIGITTGLLYYIRPNGILLLAGLPVYLFFNRTDGKKAFTRTGIALAAFLVITAPWFLRYIVLFGNPIHIAGGANLLRASSEDPFTWTFMDFVNKYSPLILVKMSAIGSISFFKVLHFFEKILFILPFAGVLIRFIRSRGRCNMLLSPFYVLTLAACFYLSYRQSWAAVRYMVPLLPFVYAYGIAELHRLSNLAARFLPNRLRLLPTAALLVLLLAPVYYPQRYYLRAYADATDVDRTYSRHRELLERLVPEDGYYLADSYGQLAFLSTRNCVGLQSNVDSTMLPEFLARYHPTLLILSTGEESDPRIRSIFNEIVRAGVHPEPATREDGATYYRLQPEPIGTATRETPHDR
jgi:hypothetical protein